MPYHFCLFLKQTFLACFWCVSCLPLALPMLVAGKGDSSGFGPVSTFLTLLRHGSVVVLRVGLSSRPVPSSPTGKTSRGHS